MKVDGKVSLLTEQPKVFSSHKGNIFLCWNMLKEYSQPFVGPVTVYASREGSTPFPGVIKHLNIRIAGEFRIQDFIVDRYYHIHVRQ